MDPKAKPEVDMEAVGGPSKLPAIIVTKRGLKEFKLNIPVKPSTENNTMRTRMNTVLPWMGRVGLDRTSFVVVVFGLVGALIMLYVSECFLFVFYSHQVFIDKWIC